MSAALIMMWQDTQYSWLESPLVSLNFGISAVFCLSKLLVIIVQFYQGLYMHPEYIVHCWLCSNLFLAPLDGPLGQGNFVVVGLFLGTLLSLCI